MVDPGAPVRIVGLVASGEPAAEVAVNGFSIIEADDAQAAQLLLSTHPFVGRGGTLQLSEYVTV